MALTLPFLNMNKPRAHRASEPRGSRALGRAWVGGTATKITPSQQSCSPGRSGEGWCHILTACCPLFSPLHPERNLLLRAKLGSVWISWDSPEQIYLPGAQGVWMTISVATSAFFLISSFANALMELQRTATAGIPAKDFSLWIAKWTYKETSWSLSHFSINSFLKKA